MATQRTAGFMAAPQERHSDTRRLWPALPARDFGKFAYLVAVIAAGSTLILLSLLELRANDPGVLWLVLTGLTVLGGAATLRLPNVAASFSISDSFTITTALLLGPAAATITVAIDSLVISLRLARRGLGVWRLLFNATAPALAMWISATLFFRLAGVEPLIHPAAAIESVLVPLAAFTASYFVLNTGLIAGAIALHEWVSVVPVWRRHFLPLWLTYFGGAAVAGLFVALNSRGGDLIGLALVAPIPLILYATLKMAVGRIEDQVGHLGQMNRMNLKTIEALTTAIEAKDGVTHDHIRRVQVDSLRLAQRLGITHDDTLKAIEAAALLHDIGKLAVPERILNKPGKLTAAEYEQMKRHVDVGTEILSAVDFPYPIVPIVAAHHERWDGSGYPRGLHGTHIPIGARILSVVDCYDAVTSDRPYRTALSESQALEILVERRGTMYDPVVVDAFVRMLHEAPAADSTPAKPAATRIYDVSSDPSPPAATPGAPDDVQAIMALSRLAADEETGGDILNLAARLVRRLVPGSTCGFYRLSGNSLVLQHAVGPIAVHLQGLTIAMNERVTGWVAAYRQPVINADPGLDLSELHFPSGFGSCASVPLIDQGRVVGVVTVYANGPGAFSDDRAQQLQMMAPYLAQIFDRANQSASMPAHRGETSGPTAHAFQSNSRRMPTSAGSAMGSGRHLTAAQYAPRRG